MLFGMLIILDNVQILAAQFPDGQVYIHEPIANTYASIDDFILDYPEAQYEVIGPVIAINHAKAQLAEHYEESVKVLLLDYKRTLRMYDSFMEQILPVNQPAVAATAAAGED